MKPDSVTAHVEAALHAANLRQKAIANNMANLGTPGYRRQDVRFESLLEQALASGGTDPRDIEPEVFQPMETPVNGKGNDVDVEYEVGQMLKNVGRYKTLLRVMAKKYQMMHQAMDTR